MARRTGWWIPIVAIWLLLVIGAYVDGASSTTADHYAFGNANLNPGDVVADIGAGKMMTAEFDGSRTSRQVVLIECRGDDPEIPILALQEMTEAQIKHEMAAAGFEFVENRDILPQQRFLVFRRPI